MALRLVGRPAVGDDSEVACRVAGSRIFGPSPSFLLGLIELSQNAKTRVILLSLVPRPLPATVRGPSLFRIQDSNRWESSRVSGIAAQGVGRLDLALQLPGKQIFKPRKTRASAYLPSMTFCDYRGGFLPA